MQFEELKQKEIDATNPQVWIDLCNQEGDFNIILNRDILRQMVYGFQMMTNEKSKEYCMEQEMEKINVMDQMYGRGYSESVELLKQITTEKENLALVNVRMERSFNVTNVENERIIKQIETNNTEIAKKQSVLRYEENDMKKQMQERQEVLLSKQQERDRINENLMRTVNQHNEMIEEYDKMYNSYNQYKKAYDEARQRREVLRNKQHHY